MKTLIAFISFIILNAECLQAQDASKAETIEWLTTKLLGVTAEWTHNYDGVGLVPARRNNKQFSISTKGKLRVVQENGFEGHWVLYEVSLRELSPNAQVKQLVNPNAPSNPSVFNVILQSNKKGAVSVKNDTGGNGVQESITFSFTDQELANRVAKAFKHLIELSGGTKEPF